MASDTKQRGLALSDELRRARERLRQADRECARICARADRLRWTWRGVVLSRPTKDTP